MEDNKCSCGNKLDKPWHSFCAKCFRDGKKPSKEKEATLSVATPVYPVAKTYKMEIRMNGDKGEYQIGVQVTENGHKPSGSQTIDILGLKPGDIIGGDECSIESLPLAMFTEGDGSITFQLQLGRIGDRELTFSVAGTQVDKKITLRGVSSLPARGFGLARNFLIGMKG
jgi:hypothetical protein